MTIRYQISGDTHNLHHATARPINGGYQVGPRTLARMNREHAQMDVEIGNTRRPGQIDLETGFVAAY